MIKEMKKIHYRIVIVSLIFSIGLIYLILLLQIINAEKIALGIKVAGLNLGGRQLSVSQKILEEQWQERLNRPIFFVFQEKNWSSSLTTLGFQINYQTTIEEAYQIIRRPSALLNLKNQLAALFGFFNLEPNFALDQEKFQKQTAELFKEIEKPTQNASLVFNEELNDFSLQHSDNGLVVEQEKLLADLSEQIKSSSPPQSVLLQLIAESPSIKNDEVESAKNQAQRVLANQPYYLIFEERSWTIDKKTLLDWTEFKPVKKENSDNEILGFSLNQDKVKTYLSKITLVIDRPVTNAQLKIENNRAVVFSPAKEGFKVFQQETINQLIKNLLDDPPVKKTVILATQTAVKKTLDQTNTLGINSLLGQGVSNFAGSPTNRIHNIKTGAAKFNGLILEPGQEFSFNTLLGGSGPDQGFLPELVIKKKKTVPEYGGGLCQVSTTLFRTAVKTGLKITERAAHAFPVVYYNPQGFDATVYEPRPDLRFINNTPASLLIKAKIEGTKLFFNFYGTDDGRETKVLGPYVLEKKEDGSMKTTLTQEVYQNNQLIEKQVFNSSYQSPDLYTTE